MVSDGCHSIRLYNISVIFEMRVAMGHTRVGSVSHGSVEDRLFELLGSHQFGVSLSTCRVLIGLGLSSVNN